MKQNNTAKKGIIVVGITGGIGSGKSEIVKYLKAYPEIAVCDADEVAKKLQKKGEKCYFEMVDTFGNEILNIDGEINRESVAKIVFEDRKRLAMLNKIVHPVVKQEIQALILEEEKKGKKLFFMEVQLLIEDHYEQMCDTTWYIYADISTRINRLMESRNYTKEKIESIMRLQNNEETFRAFCDTVIDNSGHFEKTKEYIDLEVAKLAKREETGDK